uniref:Diguanylate cyclase n=1 Tax=Lyngbya confervoides BDU141951 TaxID=1574623 RepID=A0A8T6QWH1_9CYAN
MYRAEAIADARPVILKILKADYPTTEQLKRYQQEYRLCKELNCAGVIKAYQLQTWRKTLVIAFEDFGGIDLEQWRSQQAGPVSIAAGLEIGLKIAQALAELHRHNVIHKDINPANVVLHPPSMQLKIIDLGISTQLSRETLSLRSLEAIEGTPAYLSPEQTGRMNRPLDYRTDFYSLGATLYDLLTGRPPFVGADLAEMIHSHLARPPLRPEALNAEIPPMVSRLVLRLLAKNAEERYYSADGVVHDLQQCLTAWNADGQIPMFELGQADYRDRLQIPAKLYGRETEVAALLAACDRTAQPDTPAEYVLVSGYSGIGKTALVQETHKLITAQRGNYTSGKFDQLQRNLPYSALIQAFTTLVRQLLTRSEAEVAQWRSHLQQALTPNAAVLIEIIPDLELILGPQPAVPTLSATAAQNRLNRVFEQFIRVFSQPERPLILFLDDLQWADNASLQLIKVILQAEAHQALLLIGAYRDNEVDAMHPLRQVIAELQQAQVRMQELHLQPLKFEQIGQLLHDTFPQTPTAARDELARLLKVKTGGNPFFMGEFLKSLETAGLITCDRQQGWQWHLSDIEAANMTDNVVALMVSKLQQLPPATQAALQVGAAIGNHFTLQLLAAVQAEPLFITAAHLWQAAQAGFIIPENDNYKLWQAIADSDLTLPADQQPAEVSYRFLHDRVQQAAYSLIAPEQLATLHWRIGRTWQQQLTPDQQQECLFDLLNHLNYGWQQLHEPSERLALAQLNLAAGQKGIAAAAYGPAWGYLNTGLQCLGEQGWQQQYALTLALTQAAAEAAFLNGDFEQMDQLITTVVSHANGILDCVPVYTVQIQALMARHELAAAAQLGVRVLRQLGVRLPQQPNQIQILWGLGRTKIALLGQSPEALVQLSTMQAPEAIAATQVLASIASATYLAVPNLFPLTVFKQVELSARQGNLPVSAFSYAMYGIILCGVIGDLNDGYQFGQLAMALLDRFETRAISARTLFVVNAFIRHWREPLSSTRPELQQGFQVGCETGDLEYASFCGQMSIMHRFFLGESLPELAQYTDRMATKVLKFKKQPIYELIQQSRQVIHVLTANGDVPLRLEGPFYNAAELLPQHLEDDYRTAIFYFYSYKLFLHYLFDQPQQALVSADQAKPYLKAVVALYISGWFTFYDALARLELAATANLAQRRSLLRTVRQHRRQLKRWAQSAPANYSHKLALVDAELHRLQRRPSAAGKTYDRAIDLALQHDFIAEAGLACERAARFYLARQRLIVARAYFQEAVYLYRQWGATAKVGQLEASFGEHLQLEGSIASFKHPQTLTSGRQHSTTGNHRSEDLDLLTVIETAKTIAEEIHLDQLLTTLMQLLIENAGAQRGLLLFEVDGQLAIAASYEVASEPVDLTSVMLTAASDRLSTGVVNYVARTGDNVVLNDATQADQFEQDPYIQTQQPRSLLCAPLHHQGKLAGIVYLENNLVVGAFTPQRLELVNLISAQAAISLDNARLYEQTRESERQLMQFIEAMPIGVGIFQGNGTPHYMNQQAQILLNGAATDKASVEPLTQLFKAQVLATGDRYPADKLPIHQAMRGIASAVDDLAIRAGDRTIPIELHSAPIMTEAGQLKYVIAVFQDITERQRAQKLLADYSHELQQAVRQRTTELAQEVKERQRAQEQLLLANQELHRLANVDGLTQVSNRRSFDQKLDTEWRRLQRTRMPLSLILFDVDFFKRYNDEYGHQAGDACLVRLAQAVTQVVNRSTDMVARYGGEEFAIVLPETTAAGAIAIANRVQQAVATLAIPHKQSEVAPYVTLSMGIASQIPATDSTPTDLIAQADAALYQAKRQGRDRYCVSPHTESVN